MGFLQGLNVFLNNMMGKLGDNDNDFASQVQWLCQANRWEPSAIDERRALLPFRMGAAASTCVLITNGAPFQAMLVFGSLTFSKRSVPDQLSTALMGRSAGLNLGTWLLITGRMRSPIRAASFSIWQARARQHSGHWRRLC